jgi:hypothetical protein
MVQSSAVLSVLFYHFVVVEKLLLVSVVAL